MSNKQLILLTMIAVLAAVVVFLNWPAKKPVNLKTNETNLIRSAKSDEVDAGQTENGQANTLKQKQETSLIDAFQSAVLVSKAYAAELQSPPYSQRLTERDLDRLEPNYFSPQSILVDDSGAEISATLSKYRHIYPEPIFATLVGDDISSAELILINIADKAKIKSSKFVRTGNQWLASLEGEESLPRQLQANVVARVNGNTVPVALSLKYLDSVASLEGFESVNAVDADMVITAKLTTRKSGLYRMRANLFDQNRKPIAHLVGKKRLNRGSVGIELKAHQSVLVGKEAPFYLKTFVIELMSPKPGVPTEYGHSEIKEYEISDFMVSSLTSEPYQPSEQEIQRLELLQKMAAGG